jgi:hypothetical protein
LIGSPGQSSGLPSFQSRGDPAHAPGAARAGPTERVPKRVPNSANLTLGKPSQLRVPKPNRPRTSPSGTTHNPSVGGSNPPRPIGKSPQMWRFRRLARVSVGVTRRPVSAWNFPTGPRTTRRPDASRGALAITPRAPEPGNLGVRCSSATEARPSTAWAGESKSDGRPLPGERDAACLGTGGHVVEDHDPCSEAN